MNTITIVFTKSYFSPISWLVRYFDKRSISDLSESSHCFISISNSPIVYDAYFTEGVRKLDIKEALKGSTVVKTNVYTVPDVNSAYTFLERQIGKKYDLLGSMKLKKSKHWSEDDSWYCYSLAAGALRAAGIDIFYELDYIGEKPLLNLTI